MELPYILFMWTRPYYWGKNYFPCIFLWMSCFIWIYNDSIFFFFLVRCAWKWNSGSSENVKLVRNSSTKWASVRWCMFAMQQVYEWSSETTLDYRRWTHRNGKHRRVTVNEITSALSISCGSAHKSAKQFFFLTQNKSFVPLSCTSLEEQSFLHCYRDVV